MGTAWRLKSGHSDLIVWLASSMRGLDANGVPSMKEPIGTYVELGLRKGRTFNEVIPHVKRAVGVDIHLNVKVARAKNVELYEMSTAEFAKIWNDPIDLLFIDACHEYPAVTFDFDMFAPFVRPHLGVVVLHDTYPWRAYATAHSTLRKCWRAASDIFHDPKYAEWEIVTLPVTNCGLSIARRAPIHMGWKDAIDVEKGIS